MRSVVTVRSWLERVMPKAQAEPKQRSNRHWLVLSDSELSDIIDCVANAADRAESSGYNMAGTPRARQLARDRAKRLYALVARLLEA